MKDKIGYTDVMKVSPAIPVVCKPYIGTLSREVNALCWLYEKEYDDEAAINAFIGS